MKRFNFLTGIVLTCSTVAFAQDNENSENLFKQLDTNSDGKLVADEIPEEQSRFFERLVRIGDTDNNGELTQSEFSKATSDTIGPAPAGNLPGRRPENSRFDGVEFFKRLDRNGDGKLTRSELPDQVAERLGPVFAKSGKEALTLEDFQQLRQNMERAGRGQAAGGATQFGNPAEIFKRLDQNGDGKLTAEEAPEQGRRMVAAILERSNKGQDGSLTLQEFEAAINRFNRGPQNDRQRPAGNDTDRPKNADRPSDDRAMRRTGELDRPDTGGPAFLRILDANRDGRLTRDELSNAVVLLERLDQNQDGALDPRELFGGSRPDSMNRSRENSEGSRSDRPRRPASESGDDTPKPAGTSKRPQGRRPGNGSAEEIFKQVDRDRDGKISQSEAPDRMKQNFDRLDSNSDGSVSLEELQQAFNRTRRQK